MRAVVGRSVWRTGQEESEGASLVEVLRPESLSQDSLSVLFRLKVWRKERGHSG